ncbi:MAG: 50S ribosomal protein L4 [Myxococcota bacterium]|nr:50S ribosomal protein L4 [Myxococcota bacterium]
MATADVVSVKNKKVASVELNPSVFEAKVRPHLYHAEVRRQLAGRRQGNHSTKNRAAVSGGGAKPYRQKGTGRARQGTTRAPQFAGGGVVFGPVPRTYEHKLTKKMRRAALASALTQWLSEGAITVVDEIKVEEYKTKQVVEILQGLGLAESKVLIVTEDVCPTLEASSRNIPGVGLVRAEGLNVYDVLRHPKMLMTRAALEALQARLSGAAQEETS